MIKRATIGAAALVATLALAAPAFANVHVARGTTVDEIRVLGQDVRVDGRARGPVIVVGGTLTVGPTGQASNVTVIAGGIRTEPGGRLTGDVFQFGGSIPDLSGWRFGAALAAAVLVRSLLVWLLVTGARSIAASRYVGELADRFQEAPGRTLTAGALASLGAAALAALCALTVVGVPIALMLIGALIVGLVGGVAMAARTVGPAARDGSTFLWWLAIPALGDALLALAVAAGIGGTLRWVGDARHRRFSLPRS